MTSISVVLFVALLATVFVSSASASHLSRFEGVHRKLLSGLRGKKFPWKIAAAEEAQEDKDYGPPGSNPPYHEDPPSAFTMTSVGELKSLNTVVDIHSDYAPVNIHSPDYDYFPSGIWSSKTVDSHTDYAPLRPDPADNGDYPSPGIWTPKTVDSHTDYAPLRPDPADNGDYPSPGIWSSKTDDIHTDYAPLRPDPADNHDYPSPGIWSTKTIDSHTDYVPLRTDPVPNDPPAR